MKGHPLVSVIIPVYNRVNLIEQTLQSVINQTYSYWEAIVVDDGSTDGSYELVIKLAELDQRIKTFRRDQQPKGAPTCRNIGITKSAGQYLIFLDSDDLLAPFCLDQRVSLFLENKKFDFIVLPTLLFSNEVNDLNIQWNIETAEDDLLRFFGLDALWPIMGPIYKREAILNVGGFREDLPFWQDFDLHIRCLLSGLSYRKFFNHRPDNYVRKNLKDSISRTIPLVKDTVILQKRIEFYISLLRLIKEKNIVLTLKQKHALMSVLLYFTSSYFRTHNSLQKFSKEWNRVKEAMDIEWLPHRLNFVYGMLKSLPRRNILFRKMNDLYARIFNRELVNYNIIFESRMGKIRKKILSKL